jgi:hypothetical protein
MTKKEYHEYLQSPQWAWRRQQVWERSGGRCEHMSGGDDAAFSKYPRRCEMAADNVHHLTYERVGHERFEDLIHVCRRHHLMYHILEARCEVCDVAIASDEASALAEVDAVVEWAGTHDLQSILDKLMWIDGATRIEGYGWLCPYHGRKFDENS